MSQPKINKGVCFEDAPAVIMDRVVGASAANITQASITAITYLVSQYDSAEDAEAETNGTAITAEVSAGAVSSLVFDTLQTDNDWEADDAGYNFKFTVPKASFPTRGKWFRVEVWFDPASGEDFPVVWIFECLGTARD